MINDEQVELNSSKVISETWISEQSDDASDVKFLERSEEHTSELQSH